MKHWTPANLEELADLRREPGYVRVREFLERAREDKRRELEQPSEQDKTAFLRGVIAGLTFGLDAPENLLREARKTVIPEAKGGP